MSVNWKWTLGAEIDPSFNNAVNKAKADIQSIVAANRNADLGIVRSMMQNAAMMKGQQQAPQSWASQAWGGFRNASGMSGGNPFSAAAIGGFAGGVAGMGIAAVTSSAWNLARSFTDLAKTTISLADHLNDIAEQFGGKPGDAFRLQLGAAYAGVPGKTLFGATGNVKDIQSKALAGDANAQALLAAYGIPMEGLAGRGAIDIMQRVRGSLGSGGVLPKDRSNLTALLGSNPERILAAIGAMPPEDAAFNSSISGVGKMASIGELYDLKRKRRDMEATAKLFSNPLEYAWYVLHGKGSSAMTDLGSAYGKIMSGSKGGAAIDAARTAGDYNYEESKKEKRIRYNYDWKLPGGELERMGGATSIGAFILRTQTFNIARKQLETLEDISKKLSGPLQVAVGGLAP